jgi:hypothetical protein
MSSVFTERSLFNPDFLIKGGRAVLFPVYKGTYERMTADAVAGPSTDHDETIQRSKDLRRSLDYLETRTDIDHSRLAFYGTLLLWYDTTRNLSIDFLLPGAEH